MLLSLLNLWKDWTMSNAATYTVEGMSCNGCATKVTNAVTGVDGVETIDVDLATGTLEVVGDADAVAIRAAVAGIGYSIRES